MEFLKNKINNYIIEFEKSAINHFKYTQEGDWEKANFEIKKINSVYKEIKQLGHFGRSKLLSLIFSDKAEVSSMAATYSMRFDPQKCLDVFKLLSEKNIPHISSAATQAIENWNSNEWYIN